MLHHITINSKQLYMIGLGMESHFGILQKNIEKYKNEKLFWLYDKQKLDMAYFLANSPTKVSKVTFITRNNFETIQINEKPQNKKILNNDKVLNVMENTEFRILNRFQDMHPFRAYRKMCSFMNVVPKQQVMQLFNQKYCHHPISNNSSFLPTMNQIRKKYLDVQGLKLRTLNRINSASVEQYEQKFRLWKDHYQIQPLTQSIIYESGRQEQIEKRQWMVRNSFGWEVEAKYVFEGYGKKFSSFIF